MSSSILVTFFVLLSTKEITASSESCTGPLLYTQVGSLLGKSMKTQLGREIYAFFGVPYAKPPIGDLRFRPPQPLKSWNNILDARFNQQVKCLQTHAIPTLIDGQEDCLVLQIFIPTLPDYRSLKKNLYPVMVFIHGGSFLSGGGSQDFYGPQKLLDRDVILVNVNYRLGPFGFLSTGDDEAPGNVGLLDQVEALRWIHDNIEDFGGDPSKVIIFGESAGAASAIHLLLSPLTKGLFYGAIAQSGTALITELRQHRPLAITAKLAGMLECPNNSTTSEMIACLRTKSGEDIIKGLEKMSLVRAFPPQFLPVVEHEHPGAFQTKDFQKALEDGDFQRVPVISGINKDEAILTIQPIIDYHGGYNASLMDTLFNSYVRKYSVYNTDEAFAKVKEEYFNIDLNNETAFKIAFAEFLSDVIFKAPNDLTVRLLSRYVPTYMYVFEYRGKNWVGSWFGSNDNQSVSHGDDILYLFEGMGNLNGQDHNVSQTLIDMWTNFTNFRDPTPKGQPLKWGPVTTTQFQYLRINENFTMVKSEYRAKQMDFWNNIMPKYRNIEPDIQLPRFKQEMHETSSTTSTTTHTPAVTQKGKQTKNNNLSRANLIASSYVLTFTGFLCLLIIGKLN